MQSGLCSGGLFRDLNAAALRPVLEKLPSARKQLAVPFRAADWPSERSEWAQPDVAILLTQLSYYSDGLSLAQLVQAVQVLLSQGENAQTSHFKEWFDGSSVDMKADQIRSLDEACKLDASNAQQMELLHIYYGSNMKTIDFWLTYCILPQETKQFPQRLSATAWHLADNKHGKIVGFSGTNDGHRLLPLQVHQSHPDDATLKATNGKMLSIILDNPSYDTILEEVDAKSGQSKPLWQSLLSTAASMKMDALIDCGALLAGVSIRKAAGHILPQLDTQRFKGVCYFDAKDKQWVVLEARGRCMPKDCSPVAERECFALFDDARCRGADLKLRQDAVGMLTLGPGMTKDKLMQAAGRLRMLGSGQSLRFVGAQEVTDKVLQANPAAAKAQGHGSSSSSSKAFACTKSILGKRGSNNSSSSSRSSSSRKKRVTGTDVNSHHVLQWVMANTVDMMRQGILEHAKKGLHFVDSKAAAAQGEPLFEHDHHELQALYGEARVEREVGEEVRLLAEQRQAQWKGGHMQSERNRTEQELQLLQQTICERSVLHGHGHVVISSRHGADEECERELQKEEEEEEEQERQLPRVQAQREQDWRLSSKAITATSAQQLSTCIDLLRLPDVVTNFMQPSSLGSIPWSPQVLCTTNFVQSVVLPAGGGANLSEYMRPLDALLLFADGSVLLLSEREADALQSLIWSQHKKGKRSSATPVLAQLCYVRLAFRDGSPTFLAQNMDRSSSSSGRFLCAQSSQPHSSTSSFLTLSSLTNLQLFNGDAMYGGSTTSSIRERTKSPPFIALRALVSRRRQATEELLSLRGKLGMFPRSDVELASENVGQGAQPMSD